MGAFFYAPDKVRMATELTTPCHHDGPASARELISVATLSDRRVVQRIHGSLARLLHRSFWGEAEWRGQPDVQPLQWAS